MFIEQNENGLVYMSSTLIPLRHAFTTRYGGVSRGHLATLNLLSDKGDEPENVRENYRRVCALFGVSEDDCAVTKQVHGIVKEEAKRGAIVVIASHNKSDISGICDQVYTMASGVLKHAEG